MSIVIPRSVWGPRYSNGEPGLVIGTAAWEAAGREMWAHHSTTNPPGPDATLAEDCAHMREFEAIGQSRFGQGISYTWVGMPSGRVFEGHSIDRRGAHTYGRNDRSRAYCFAGNYDVAELPDRMARAAAALLRELGATFDGGHRDVFATACPGRYAYARIGEINRLAVSGESLNLEDDVSFSDKLTNAEGYSAPAGELLAAAEMKIDRLTRPIPVAGEDRTTDVVTEIGWLPANFRAVNAQLAALVELVAAKAGISPTEFAAAVDAAVKKHTPSAADIAKAQEATLAPLVEAALKRVQDTDNIDEARQTATELLRLISNAA